MIFLFDNLVKISEMKQYIISTLRMHLLRSRPFWSWFRLISTRYIIERCVCVTNGLESSQLEIKYFASIFILKLIEMS